MPEEKGNGEAKKKCKETLEKAKEAAETAIATLKQIEEDADLGEKDVYAAKRLKLEQDLALIEAKLEVLEEGDFSAKAPDQATVDKVEKLATEVAGLTAERKNAQRVVQIIGEIMTLIASIENN